MVVSVSVYVSVGSLKYSTEGVLRGSGCSAMFGFLQVFVVDCLPELAILSSQFFSTTVIFPPGLGSRI